MSGPQTITRRHLDRLAIVYVRQSTLMQVREHPESTARQYALAEDAARLGWPASAIVVIDTDLGLHAAASNSGLLAYVPGRDLSVGQLAWVDRKGTVEPLEVPECVYGAVRLAPNGTRLAVPVADVTNYIWSMISSGAKGRRLPYDVSHDGKRLLIIARRTQRHDLTKLHLVTNWFAALPR